MTDAPETLWKDKAKDLIRSLRSVQQYNEAGTNCIASTKDCLGAADTLEAIMAENERLRDGLDSIKVYGSDTLSGPSDALQDTRNWQRAAVAVMTRRAAILLDGLPWDTAPQEEE